MLSKFSVKKPFTVLVAVIMVIVLGVVSFIGMTPNLMPNMDFPYMIVVTTYPGASPELVETTVTKPLEQALATLDGVKEITSASSDNYSMVTIEYEDGTNMDTATVDVSGKIDTLEGNWDDTVGTPTLMKINPDMMPASVVAVDVKGMEVAELTDYVNNTLLNRLEGVDGVASISTIGDVEEGINVSINQKKLKKINKKVQDAIDSKFDESKSELNSNLTKLNDGLEQTKEGQQKIQDGKDRLEKQRKEVNQQLSSAQSRLDQKQSEILNGKMQILNTLSSLTAQRTQLQSTYQQLVSIQKIVLELQKNIQDMTSAITKLEAYKTTVDSLNTAIETLTPGTDEYNQAKQQLEEIDAQLKEMGITSANLSDKIDEYSQSLASLQGSMDAIKQSLSTQGFTADTLQDAIDELKGGIDKIDAAIEGLNTTLKQLEAGTLTLSSALQELNRQKDEASYKMNSAYVELRVNEATLSTTQTQLESTKKELETALDTIDEKQEETKDKSDLTKTITLEMVSGILTAENFSMPAGYITQSGDKYLVRVGDKLTDQKEIENLLLFDLGMDDLDPIYLKDVADVFVKNNSDEVYAKINGSDGVMLSFTKSSEAAVATVCANIENKLKSIKEDNPDFNYTVLMDQGEYINVVINSVLENLVIGAVFAVIILLLFLRDIKPTLIVACSIPLSVVFAIVLMYFSGVTLNIISLSGLAVGVGMLVDNSVVVIENVYRLRNMGMSAVQAAMNGARQVAGAITASTLTTVCVFLPIVFVQGLTRQIFSDLALTITYSLMASLIVALTLVPAMGKSLFKRVKPRSHKFMDGMLKYYEKAVRFTLAHRAISLIAAFVLLVGSTALALSRGFSFMPSASSSEIQVSISMPKGSKMADTVKASEKLLKVINESDKYETVGAMVGNSMSIMGMGGSTDTQNATLYMVLKDEFAKQSNEISTELQKQADEMFKDGTEVSVSGGSMSSMSALTGSGVGVKIYCDDLDKLQKTANDITKIISDVDGIEKADNGISDTTSELRITVDKEKAMKNSLTVAQVFQQVASLIKSENTATSLTTDNGSAIDVVVVDQQKEEFTPEKLMDQKLTYTTTEGDEKTIALGEISTIKKADSMSSISRENQKRYLTVTGDIKDGYTTTDVSSRVQSAVEKYQHGSEITIDFSGENETTMESVFELFKMIALGIVFIYLIMVAQFQSLKSPFIVMFTIPLAFTGGFIGLFITGFDISVVSLIGFVMLCGVVVNNGIVLVDYINQLRIEGMEKKEALVQAGKIRMRPILMTAITTIIGLFSMALGIGEGAEMMQPVAIVCIGGLLYATIMTLFIVPVMYDLFNRKPMRVVSEEDLKEIDD